MSHEMPCPACHSTLRVPSDFSEPFLTCPRCLASVANPAHATTTSQQSSEWTASRDVAPADREARFGLKSTYGLVLLLTIVAILGVYLLVLKLSASGEKHLAGMIYSLIALACLFVVLDALVLLPIGRVILTLRLKPAHPLVMPFKVLGSVALFLALAAAIVVFFGLACSVMIRGV
jgi:hypothetical protein